MEIRQKKKKLPLLLLLSLLLLIGFLTTSLISYYVSLASLRKQIASSELPLTSDNIYSEIQRDLLRPIFISSLMANDTFLKDWILDGEKDTELITKYLKEILNKYHMFTSFFVSDATRNYYHPNGILKQVKPGDPRDIWYFRVREMKADYEINVDPDMANKDTMTVFINHRIYDYNGKYIGAAGVGLATDSLKDLIEYYRAKYDRNIYFTDRNGVIILSSSDIPLESNNIHTINGLAPLASQILSGVPSVLKYRRHGSVVHLNTRFIPELDWYLIVAQTEERAIGRIHNALIVNLILCALISAIVILLTSITINAYQRITHHQQEKIIKQHQDLLVKNTALEKALAEVRSLSGLLPICASCKKICNDQGSWQPIESYIHEHSEAEFSHGICPECSKKLYPEYQPKDKPGEGKRI